MSKKDIIKYMKDPESEFSRIRLVNLKYSGLEDKELIVGMTERKDHTKDLLLGAFDRNVSFDLNSGLDDEKDGFIQTNFNLILDEPEFFEGWGNVGFFNIQKYKNGRGGSYIWSIREDFLVGGKDLMKFLLGAKLSPIYGRYVYDYYTSHPELPNHFKR